MKIAVLGDSGTGKTNFVRQLLNQGFCFTHNCTVYVKEELIQLDEGSRQEVAVVDTPGCLSFFDATHHSLKGVDAFVIVFSLINRKSFDHIENWRRIISEITAASPTIWLLGTKSDLLDACIVDDTEIADAANRNSCRGFFKLSAKHRADVLRVFHSVLRSVSQVTQAAKRSVLFAREVKLCILGLDSVGSSSLLLRLVNDTFSLTDVRECQFKHRFLSVSGEKVKLCLHNLSGTPALCLEPFLRDRKFDAVVLVFDVTSLDSLLRLSALLPALRPLSCMRALVGTKSDLTDGKRVTAEHVKAFCETENIACHFEVSSKTGHNVLEAFRTISELVMKTSKQ